MPAAATIILILASVPGRRLFLPLCSKILICFPLIPLLCLSAVKQRPPKISGSKTADCSGCQKHEKEQVSLISIDQWLPSLSAVLLSYFLNNRFVNAGPLLRFVC